MRRNARLAAAATPVSPLARMSVRLPALAIGLACLAIALAADPAAAQAPPPSGFPGKAPEGPPAEILSFTAEPAATAAPGVPVKLRWEVVNAYSLRIDPGLAAVPTRGDATVTPAATTTYTLRVTGTGGVKTESVTVTVAGTAPAKPTATAAAQAARPIPRLADGKPDLSGVYLGGRDVKLVAPARLKPGAEGFRVDPSADELGQGALCLPPGVPASTLLPYPLEIVQRPDVVVILYEAYNLFRIIPIRPAHAEDLDPLWMGDSVAHWEGDMLVVDVTSFNDKTRVAGYKHTQALHVVERYTRTAYDTVEYRATAEDPNVFAAPVEYAGNLVLHPEWQIGEYVCAENNKDYSELRGP
ncbi:MAG TPA: hypothetical protein VFV10_15800 [Gammaproteobacteria bacterium]|nr:hypothetical protein [Gammaproteobacteria bacterium]